MTKQMVLQETHDKVDGAVGHMKKQMVLQETDEKVDGAVGKI